MKTKGNVKVCIFDFGKKFVLPVLLINFFLALCTNLWFGWKSCTSPCLLAENYFDCVQSVSSDIYKQNSLADRFVHHGVKTSWKARKHCSSLSRHLHVTHTHTHTHTHTQVHTYAPSIHVNTHTCKCTHTHTHTLSLSLSLSLCFLHSHIEQAVTCWHRHILNTFRNWMRWKCSVLFPYQYKMTTKHRM